MIKNKLMMIICVIFIILGIMNLYFGVATNFGEKIIFGEMRSREEFMHIPNQDEVKFIEIYDDFMNDISKYHTIESENEITEIYDKILSGKKKKVMDSINDVPHDVDGKLTRLVLTNGDDIETILLVYKTNKGDYFLEQPYVGVYEMSLYEYEILSQYFVS